MCLSFGPATAPFINLFAEALHWLIASFFGWMLCHYLEGNKMLEIRCWKQDAGNKMLETRCWKQDAAATHCVDIPITCHPEKHSFYNAPSNTVSHSIIILCLSNLQENDVVG